MSGARENERQAVESAPPARRWLFGNAVLDERSLTLSVNGDAIEIERKPLEVLLHLLHHAGEVVTKDELLAAVWPGRILSDSALTSCLSKLREALRDEEQAIVKTVHGYGYRLVAAVRTEPAFQPQAAGGSARSRVPLAAAALAVAASVATAAGIVWLMGRPLDRSIAVLPFDNVSADPAASEHVAGGVHESVLTQLAQIPELKVISRASVMEYRGAQRKLRDIGRELGVANILDGSVQRVGDRVRVTARLTDVSADRHLWAAVYDRDMRDLFAIQSDVAAQVARAVEAQLTPDQQSALARPPTDNTEAYDLYLRALDYDRRSAASRDNLLRMQPLLERALALDPDFALAHALLSRTHLRMYFYAYDPSAERLEAGRVAAEAARRLRPELMDGHLAMGLYHAYGTGEHERALTELTQAMLARPNAAEVHRAIGGIHRFKGRWDDALNSFSRAVELDPRNVNDIVNLATLYQGLRRYDAAARWFDRAVTLAPDDVFNRMLRSWLAIAAKGDLEPMREVLQSVPRGQDPDNMVSYARYELAMFEGRFADAQKRLAEYPSDWLPASGGTGREPKALAAAGVQELLGDSVGARQLYARARDLIMAEIGSRPANPADLAALAVAHSGLGEHEAALAALQRALDSAAQTNETLIRARIAGDVALVRWRAGQQEAALAELEFLLRTPFGISAAELRLLPEFRSLAGDPRFERLLREAANGS